MSKDNRSNLNGFDFPSRISEFGFRADFSTISGKVKVKMGKTLRLISTLLSKILDCCSEIERE
ncbi:hypothetical protein WN50_01990 [Limnoraphis robusta CS-951]|uniref:Uncharacterized protein n=1 Tax=Limnoraphis robusta CS-951 TaxID=1637645 RepID=A0A0F5YLB0_9CYAN|nr:hypothetical protein WN50_01990 [Limnoraphis robusta CS-951]